MGGQLPTHGAKRLPKREALCEVAYHPVGDCLKVLNLHSAEHSHSGVDVDGCPKSLQRPPSAAAGVGIPSGDVDEAFQAGAGQG